MPQLVQEIFDIRGMRQLTPLNLTTTAAETAPFDDLGVEGAVYYMWSEVDCYFIQKIQGDSDSATLENSIYLHAMTPVSIAILKGDKINARSVTGTGKLRFVRLNRI